MQTLAVDASPRVHVQPVSTAQDELHPFPEVVPPSSQYPKTGATTLASPQMSVQTLVVRLSPKVHDQLASTIQLELQPSPLAVLPSSHRPAVGVEVNPSPQVSVYHVPSVAFGRKPELHTSQLLVQIKHVVQLVTVQVGTGHKTK